MADKDRIVATFRVHTKANQAKSQQAGRPIFDEMEVCEIRFAGDRNRVGVFPAHSFSRNEDREDGTSAPVTYAQRFPEQYRRFKENRQQVQEGTPLEELAFLSQAKRMELKALNIHTAETLASLDGVALKTLGMGGRELKDQAAAYLENATGSADVTRLASENARLRALLEKALAGQAQVDPDGEPAEDAPGDPGDVSEFESWDDALIKEWIKEKTGAAPRGNPSHATLVIMADELKAGE